MIAATGTGARRIVKAARAAAVLLLAACCLVLAGCGDADTASSSGSSSGAGEEKPKTTVALLTGDREAAALSELTQQYAGEHDEVAFDVQTVSGDKALRSQLTSSYTAAQRDKSSAASASSSTNAEIGASHDGSSQPVAAVVGLSQDERAKAADAKQLDADTDTDLVQDSLVIVTAQQKAITTNELLRGDYRLCMATPGSDLGKLQMKTLVRLGGATPSGRYVGALAAKDKVEVCKSTAKLFEAVAKSKKSAAIVLRSDVYRYGGVKISGEVPASAYTAPVYGCALTTFASDEQTKAARDFFTWSTTDADALRIWKKWGFALAA